VRKIEVLASLVGFAKHESGKEKGWRNKNKTITKN
jgi:hypothetical protein